ncbi:MAG: hypothetical protein OXQ94_15995 [Gemmatimonadota bacterium]|nr:hypothetical protein [Gemmatimonadota bacterium]
MKTMKLRFRATALYVALAGCSAPAPQEQGVDTVSEERHTPIGAWIAGPPEIQLSTEQMERVDELKTEYLAEFDKLGGDDRMAAVMQAFELETKYRELVRSLLTPEQLTVFDENVRTGTTPKHNKGLDPQ